MKLAERDFRLEQIREEKDEIEWRLKEMAENMEKRNAEMKAKRLQKEQATKHKSNFRKLLGVMINPFSDLGGLGDAVTDLYVTTQFELPIATALEKRRKELIEEEAKLLGVKIDDEPRTDTRESKKNEIFQRRAQRLQEKERRIVEETKGKNSSDWTNEERERVIRLDNAFNQADARDIEELAKLL
jgi:DNA polymerase III alpha subunit (gram-positive type)